MKKVCLLLIICACNSEEPAGTVSTVDPNVSAPDTNMLIDPDNPYDSSYSVALDSNETTILPADTVRGER
jgi:hypothetical protein